VRVVATDAALALIAELTAQFISRARAFTDTEVAALRRAGHSPRPAALPQKENTR
jgi:phosphopantothenoylcysteine synthetase/decarboxylase